QALSTSRRLDPATHLVASVQALAQWGLETATRDPALRRVRACSPALFNSFFGILASLSLRESCIRENRMCSLGGGRRPARFARASSDPTMAQVPINGEVDTVLIQSLSRPDAIFPWISLSIVRVTSALRHTSAASSRATQVLPQKTP